MAADPEASIALPFTQRPLNLNGELAGDVGFDPLNFSEEVSELGGNLLPCRIYKSIFRGSAMQ